MVIHSQLAAISEIKAARNTSEECEILSRFKRSFLAKRAGALSVLRNLDLRRAVYRRWMHAHCDFTIIVGKQPKASARRKHRIGPCAGYR